MPRAIGKDLAEIFGYAPDDKSANARKQWKSQTCPFVGNVCIKHSHGTTEAAVVVYGSCSVKNPKGDSIEEVIICPHRLYADKYAAIKRCAFDAVGGQIEVLTVQEYKARAAARTLPKRVGVLFGQNSGSEISVAKRGVIEVSLDWVIAILDNKRLIMAIPCEVQSIDITGNYRANWRAYSRELDVIPNSEHGMNWANVWKRLIPQLIIKSKIASTSKYCTSGSYFVLPERVYQQFEALIGTVPKMKHGQGTLSVFTYNLAKPGNAGEIRNLELNRHLCFSAIDFAAAFASGNTLPLGDVLDLKIERAVEAL